MVAAILPMTGDLPEGFGKFIVIGEDCTAIAIEAQRFTRKKAGAGNGAQVAGTLTVVSCAEALRGILDHRNTMSRGNCIDGIKISALPIERYGDYRLGTRCNRRLKQLRIHVVGARIYIHVHRFGAQQGDGFSGSNVGETRGDHFIARADAQRHLGDLQRVSAIGYAYAVLRPDESGQLLFQLVHFRAENVLAVREYTLDTSINLFFYKCLLRFQVNKFNHSLHPNLCWLSGDMEQAV